MIAKTFGEMTYAFDHGQLVQLFATITDSFSSTRKTANSVLLVQCGSQVFYFLSSLISAGYSACAQNVVSVLRNFAAIRNINKKRGERALKISFLFAVILFIIFNFVIWNFVGVICNAIIAVTILIFLFKK